MLETGLVRLAEFSRPGVPGYSIPFTAAGPPGRRCRVCAVRLNGRGGQRTLLIRRSAGRVLAGIPDIGFMTGRAIPLKRRISRISPLFIMESVPLCLRGENRPLQEHSQHQQPPGKTGQWHAGPHFFGRRSLDNQGITNPVVSIRARPSRSTRPSCHDPIDRIHGDFHGRHGNQAHFARSVEWSTQIQAAAKENRGFQDNADHSAMDHRQNHPPRCRHKIPKIRKAPGDPSPRNIPSGTTGDCPRFDARSAYSTRQPFGNALWRFRA